MCPAHHREFNLEESIGVYEGFVTGVKTEIDSRQLNCTGWDFNQTICSNPVKINVRVQQELLNMDTEDWSQQSACV